MKRHLALLFLAGLALSPPAPAQDNVVKGLYDNAILLLRQGRPDEALKDLERIYKSYPQSEYADEALYRLGVYHLENKQFQAALDSFNLLISSFGDRNMAPEAYYSIGEIYENLLFPGFDFVKADANFARVYNIYGRSDRVDDALLHSGLLKLRLGEFSNARTTLQRLVDEYPQSDQAPRGLYALGLALVNLDEPVQAMAALQRVLDEYEDKEMSLRALRVINGLYRTNVRARQKGLSLYKPDSSFASKKFKKVNLLAIDWNDNVYIASEDAPGIRVYAPDGGDLPPLQAPKETRAVFMDASEEPYIVKKNTVFFSGQDHVFRRKGSKGLEPLEDLRMVLRGPARAFYVLGDDKGTLYHFDKDENYVGTFPSFKLNEIKDMALAPTGDLYVIDKKLGKLFRVDPKGAATGSIDEKGSGYAMKEMSQVAVDRTGTLYILDAKEQKVYLFGADLKLITTFQPPGLSKPELLAVDSAGAIYIYDDKEGAIRKYL